MRSKNTIGTLAKRFALAGDRTRLTIVCALVRRRGACVSELAQLSGESVATVSHHLQALAKERLVSPVRNGKRICYALSTDPFALDLKRLACKYAREATHS